MVNEPIVYLPPCTAFILFSMAYSRKLRLRVLLTVSFFSSPQAPQTTDITKTAGGYWGMQLSTLPFKQQSAGSFAKLVGIDVAATHALYTSKPSQPFMYIGIPGRDQWKASQLLETEIFVRRQRVYSSSRGGVSSSASSYELGVETFAK